MAEASDRDWPTILRTVADYQFGAGAGAGLFAGSLDLERSRSGRPRQIVSPAGRIATFTTDGRLSLGIEGASSGKRSVFANRVTRRRAAVVVVRLKV